MSAHWRSPVPSSWWARFSLPDLRQPGAMTRGRADWQVAGPRYFPSSDAADGYGKAFRYTPICSSRSVGRVTRVRSTHSPGSVSGRLALGFLST